MGHFTDTQLEEVRQRLVTIEKEIEALLGQTSGDARPVDLELPIGRLSRADAMQMQGMAQMNRRQLDIRLQQVRVALKAVADGSYGSCRSCKGAINPERLDARPESPFCIGCQEMFEQER
jgi:DnaK suppressor protein